MKPREFYIEFDGDPLDDEKVCKRYVGTEKFSPMFPDQEVIHTREVLANEVTLDRSMVEKLSRYLGHRGNCFNHPCCCGLAELEAVLEEGGK